MNKIQSFSNQQCYSTLQCKCLEGSFAFLYRHTHTFGISLFHRHFLCRSFSDSLQRLWFYLAVIAVALLTSVRRICTAQILYVCRFSHPFLCECLKNSLAKRYVFMNMTKTIECFRMELNCASQCVATICTFVDCGRTTRIRTNGGEGT